MATATAVLDVQADAQRSFRDVMGRFATGVGVVTTRLGAETFGMTANAFMAGSLEPLLCVISIGHRAQMHQRLLHAGHFGVSFLSREQQHLARHFAGRPIAGLVPEFEPTAHAPVLKRAVAAVTADVVSRAECGDHTLFIGRVTSLRVGDAAQPLVFYAGRYARLDSSSRIDEEPPEFW